MSKRTLSVVVPAAFLLTALLAGCQRPRSDVSGMVTWKGEPVPVGLVTIEPDAEKGNTGTQTQGVIKHGRYRTLPGHGAVAGPVIVSVHGQDGVPYPNMPAGKLLFRDYQFRTELPPRAYTLDIQVPPDLTPPVMKDDEPGKEGEAAKDESDKGEKSDKKEGPVKEGTTAKDQKPSKDDQPAKKENRVKEAKPK